ncbi:MAG: phage holin family protein [Desulfomicrobium sp.]|nr:phage holin family protein [Pseudomonadota bacterium]MBV1713245.1 phage holin family protein [Desulfomicrobium sp.]MBU4571349.1 phage holin family protein [Pseudomonadota bacterium]MBU4595611.1 phage holin family protein [Pseudomonadota bacterium]MBV1720053.1 phage holin family protein [Desulfomicrobium sp.]
MNNKVDPTTQRESLSELLGQLAKNSAAVVHNEIELVIQRINEMMNSTLSGVLIIVTGAMIIFAAFMFFSAALIITLTYYMPPIISLLVTGVVFSLFGFVIALIGYKKLNKYVRTSGATQIQKEGENNE